ncbi:peptidoglycan-binding domain-containing protein [Rubrivivax gelatinosus]|nr:peptidoglycan-binding domain-containing protein [Rubrivivax gelatinosus]
MLTPTTDTTPAVVRLPAAEPSGAIWVSRFPGSASVSTLVSPFKDSVVAFLVALRAAGATVTISATWRPPERAYLMHWSWRVFKKAYDPRSVPVMAGIRILWAHVVHGSYSESGSRAGAEEMVNGFGMQRLKTAPALMSNHIRGNAIDMNISWNGGLRIAKADGVSVTIEGEPHNGLNSDLRAVGASFGVIKFSGGSDDIPHWSADGK